MTNIISLWLHSAKTLISQRMSYRIEYFISLFSMLLSELVGFIILFVIYSSSKGFPGWSFYEILLLQGVFVTVKGFCYALFGGVIWNSNVVIREGTFDFLLLKPRNLLATFVISSFDTEDISKFFGGLFITAYAALKIPNITIFAVLQIFFYSIIGILFLFSVFIFLSVFIFKVTQTDQVYSFLNSLFILGNYPSTIFSKSISTTFTSILPLFLIAAIPVQNVLKGFQTQTIISLFSVLILVTISIKLWYKTVTTYVSAGG